MRKETVREKVDRAKADVVERELTEKEDFAIRWAARNTYQEIRAYFYEEFNEDFLVQYMTVACMLRNRDSIEAMFFIGTLLRQTCCEELAELIMEMCDTKDDSIDIFVNTVLEEAYLDFKEDEFEDDEFELYDVNFDSEIDEDPFAVIKVTVDGKKAPAVRRLVESVWTL